ncbi:MAG: hypothetical protein ACLUUY_10165 [Anaerostipes hadrus]|uniref:hypothetical protein n=2 Tax=Anaerostipes hadrus TaxID=649756 RepID=UPI001FC7EF1F|nr:hypothetical protein [Anaerostipes hadrus]
MAYTKKTWVKGNTPLSAENFNHMEQGIADAHTDIAQLNSERAFLSKVFSGTSNKMIYWQRCQSEIAKALGMQISDINNEKLYIAACNGDWNAYQGLVTGAALQWDNTNLNINIGLSSDTNGAVRINFMIYRKLN